MSYLRVIMTVFLLVGTSWAQDVDSDGVPDSVDNCPATYNPDQGDWDEDGTGDACDTSCTICGNINNGSDCSVDMLDLHALFDYLYDGGPAPDQLWTAEMDGRDGINNGDIQQLIGYLCIWFGPLQCYTETGPISTSEEIVEVRMLDVPPGRDTWTTELWVWLGAYDGYDGKDYSGFVFPFSYTCATSSLTLDSITVHADSSEQTNTVIDPSSSTGLIAVNQFFRDMPLGYWKLSTMHFSLTPSSQTQRIIIDTTTVPPSNVTLLSKWHLLHSVPQIFGIPGNMTCCVGGTGNINCDPSNSVDVSDLSTLIDHMFLTQEPLCCRDEADVNHDGRNDISDLTKLVNHLFITFESLGPCPYE